MKTIGIDIRILGKRHGGIGRYVFELATHLLKRDSENQYVLFYNENDSDQADLDSLKAYANVEFVKTNIRHYSVLEQVKFPFVLDRFKLDIMHFPNFNVPLLYKKPFLVTIHDMVHHKISGAKKSRFLHFQAYKKIIQKAAEKSRKVITVSEYSKKDIHNYLRVPLDKISVIYEGVSVNTAISDKDVARVKEKYFLKRPYFLFVGVLERKKNIVTLARAFDAFLKKYRYDIDLVIAGKADRHYPDIKYKAMDIAHKDHLVFTDYVEDKDLSALYKGAHAFLNASLHEGFGLPGIEAMQYGTPLAVSNIAVFNEIYDNAAIYFDPFNPDDIAEKMNLLVKDPEFHQQLQKKSFERGQLYSWDKTAEETLRLYLETAGGAA